MLGDSFALNLALMHSVTGARSSRWALSLISDVPRLAIDVLISGRCKSKLGSIARDVASGVFARNTSSRAPFFLYQSQ